MYHNLLIVSSVVGYVYFFPQLLREQVAGEVSSVATKSLEDDKVIWRASELSKDIVNGILADEHTKLAAIGFVTGPSHISVLLVYPR